jgi:hypothetical protein
MLKVDQAPDLTGRDLLRGDTVTTVGGGITGKVKDIANDDGALFVEVRPLYRASGKGVWHAADRLLWLSRPAPAKPKDTPASNPAAGRPARAHPKKAAKPVKLKK